MLEQTFGTLENIMAASVDDIASIEDFGLITASSIVEFFQMEENRALIQKLLQNGVTFLKEEKRAGVFSGRTVVITGTLSSYKRSAAQEEIKKHAKNADCNSKRKF